MMRLFIGIEIDDAVRRRAAAIGESARRLLEPVLVVRWVPAENLHITLWFLGEVAEPRAASVLTALDRPFDVEAFDLRLGGLGAFPPAGIPRVVWLGVRDGAESLTRIHDELSDRLQPLGFAAERRPYSAHVTLGRVKSVRGDHRPREIRLLWRDLPAEAGECRIRTVTLFRSRLSAVGSTYEPLVRVPLR